MSRYRSEYANLWFMAIYGHKYYIFKYAHNGTFCPVKLWMISSWPYHISVDPAPWQLSPALSLALRLAAFRASVKLRQCLDARGNKKTPGLKDPILFSSFMAKLIIELTHFPIRKSRFVAGHAPFRPDPLVHSPLNPLMLNKWKSPSQFGFQWIGINQH